MSCKKKDDSSNDTTPPAATPNPYFTAKINGVPYTATSLGGGRAGGLLTITGQTSDTSIVLQGNFVAATTYQLSTSYSNGFNTGIHSLGTTIQYWLVSGQIIFSKFDMTNLRVSGTFNFTGHNSTYGNAVVTEGKFNDVLLTQ